MHLILGDVSMLQTEPPLRRRPAWRAISVGPPPTANGAVMASGLNRRGSHYIFGRHLSLRFRRNAGAAKADWLDIVIKSRRPRPKRGRLPVPRAVPDRLEHSSRSAVVTNADVGQVVTASVPVVGRGGGLNGSRGIPAKPASSLSRCPLLCNRAICRLRGAYNRCGLVPL